MVKSKIWRYVVVTLNVVGATIALVSAIQELNSLRKEK